VSARRLLFALVLTLGLVPASAAEAGFAPSSETIFEAEQTASPDIAADAAGNSLIVWSQEKVLGDPQEAKARRLSAGGTLGAPFDLAPGEISTEPSVAMIDPATSGELLIDGKPINAIANLPQDLRSKVQIVFQNPYGSLNPRKKIGATRFSPAQ